MSTSRGIRAGKAFIDIGTNNGPLNRGLKRASMKLKTFGAGISSIGMKVGLAGAAIVGPLILASNAFASYGDQIDKISRRTGIGAESLSELGYAASIAGVEIVAVEKSIGRMQRTLIDASMGLKTADDALASVGLILKDIENLSTEDQFVALLDALSKVDDVSKRAGSAMLLFGRSGAKLLPMIEDGAKGIDEMRKRARSLGLVLSQEDASAAAELTDRMFEMRTALKMVYVNIGAALAPVLIKLSEKFVFAAGAVSKFIKNNRELIVTALQVGATVAAAGVALTAIGMTVTGIGMGIGGLASGLAAISGLFAAIVSPVGLVTAAVVGLGVYLVKTSETGRRALAFLSGKFDQLATFAGRSFDAIKQALLAGDIEGAAEILWLSLRVAFIKGTNELRMVWEDFKVWFVDTFGVSISTIVDTARTGFETLKEMWAETVTYWIKKLEEFETKFKAIWPEVKSTSKKGWDIINAAVEHVATQMFITLDAITTGTPTDEKIAQETLDNIWNKKIEGWDAAADAAADAPKDAVAKAKEKAKGGELRVQENLRDRARKEADDRLAKASKELKDAINALKNKIAPPAGGGFIGPLDNKSDLLTGFLASLKDGAVPGLAGPGSDSSRGTFNAAAIQALQGGSAADRTAKNTEETSKNTGKLLKVFEGWDVSMFGNQFG